MSVEINSIWNFEKSGSSLLTDILAYWKLDETSGNVYDEVSSIEGTVSGADLNQSGKIGTSVYFDGAAYDYITFGNNTNFNFGTTQDFSISCWFKYSSTGNFQYIIEKYRTTSRGWGFYSQDDDEIHFYLRDVSTGNVLSCNAGSGWNNGEWHLAVVTVDRDSAMKLYIDNTSYDPQGASTSYDVSTTNDLTFATTSTSYPYTGYLDEVGFWNRALTETEISELWNSGSGLTYPFTS